MAGRGAKNRSYSAEYNRRESAKSRDIGSIPPIEDVARRQACRRSLRLFCETYNPATFCLPWCDDHLRMIARIEEAATLGALYAFAMPRGQGKTVLTRHAALWAISYGLRRYVYLIGATDSKATDTLEALRMYIRFLPLYAADFPEISYPVQRLEGITQRAHGQTCGDESTMLEWGKDRILLATVPPPPNWPNEWPLRHDGKVPTSGAVISTSGLTGEGIRGSVLTLTTGESVRPDLVLIDDPQTAESARSVTQNATREQLVSADLLGLAGPGKSISAVMPCTVIAPGDFIDCVLDRKKHPLWRGERTRLLTSMPTNMAAWEDYFEVYRNCAQKEPPDFAEAHNAYAGRRAELDEGAEASWPQRKLPGETSPIQHAMHLYCRDKRAFFAEYQNDPLPAVEIQDALKPDELSGRLNRVRRGTMPQAMTRLTAFIDVQQTLLYWVCCAWNESFGGSVVDYGVWPQQNRETFTAADARPTLVQATGIATLEGSLYAGLEHLTDYLLCHEWPQESGGIAKIERCMIDSGWGLSTELIFRFCRQSRHSALLSPSKGMGITAAQAPMPDWPKREGERRGDNWLIRVPASGHGRLTMYDANVWKSFVANRLRQAIGEKGSLLLFGDDARAHRMFAEHCCSEYAEKTFGRGREVDQWVRRPNMTENHWWDGLVGCAVAAAIGGCRLPGQEVKQKKLVRYSELYREKHG